jgi:uncharacterized membrane protein
VLWFRSKAFPVGPLQHAPGFWRWLGWVIMLLIVWVFVVFVTVSIGDPYSGAG